MRFEMAAAPEGLAIGMVTAAAALASTGTGAGTGPAGVLGTIAGTDGTSRRGSTARTSAVAGARAADQLPRDEEREAEDKGRGRGERRELGALRRGRDAGALRGRDDRRLER